MRMVGNVGGNSAEKLVPELTFGHHLPVSGGEGGGGGVGKNSASGEIQTVRGRGRLG